MNYDNYRITLMGCDDSTTVTYVLDGHEVPMLKELAEKINEAAQGSCMPTMTVEEIK